MNQSVYVDPLSSVSCRLELNCSGKILGPASGALWKRSNRTYLISNWHVFSGRNTYTGQPLVEKSGALPDTISLKIAMETINGIEWFNLDLPLHDGLNSKWLQHPTKAQDIDVAALEIPNHLLGYNYQALGEKFQEHDIKVGVGDDIFIIGYPLGLQKQFGFPIWKRGTIASEFDVPVDNLPLFLVDAATRNGMSGSPVYSRKKGSYQSLGGETVFVDGSATRFLGIYSGRYGAEDELSAQLGRVWHAKLVTEVLDGGKMGDYEIRKQ